MTELYRKCTKAYAVKNLCYTLMNLSLFDLKSFELKRVSDMPQYNDDKYVQDNFEYIINVEYYHEVNNHKVVHMRGHAI